MNYRTFEIVFILVIFLLNPIVAILFQVLLCMQKKEEYQIINLIFILTGYLCLINLHKLPESDLAVFNENFFLASKFDYYNYLLLNGKEPVFYSITYIFSHLFSVNEKMFLLFINFISYFFYELALYKFLKKIKVPVHDIIFVIIIASFFAQLFSLSAHVIRQFFATSILIYGLIQRILYNRRSYIFFLIAIFSHTTLIFFIPFLFLDKLIIRFGIFKILVSLSIFVILFTFLNTISEFVLSQLHIPFITYIFARMAQKQYFELGDFGIANIIFIILNVSVSLILLLSKNYKNRLIGRNYDIFYFIIIFLNLFILLNLNNTEIALRFDFFNYFFLPILLYIFTKYLKFNIVPFQFVFVFIWLFIFYYRIYDGTWTYIFNNNLLFLNCFNTIL